MQSIEREIIFLGFIDKHFFFSFTLADFVFSFSSEHDNNYVLVRIHQNNF